MSHVWTENQLWGAWMLCFDVKVCESLLQGRRVPVHKLEPVALRRAFRGDPSQLAQAQAAEWVEISPDMLDAISEGGPFVTKHG